MKISATIVTLNEERNIARAIESLRCVDEIVIVDSGSVDGTVEVAQRLGARVIHEPWRGYAGQKNFASERASYEWILSLDADEAVTEALEAEILELKKEGPRFDAYAMPRLAQYLGRWIRHGGWYPDKKIRLFHRNRARWVGEYVHESVHVDGVLGELQGDLLHFTCDSLSAHLRTLDRYTQLAARELLSRNQHVPLRRLMFDPAWTIFRTYVLRRGFLDGAQGIAIAWMAGLYTFLKYARARRELAG
ncbi:MAG TPA: glycosyltransferase family 2 protein [Bryobacteraceae bacterium]|nr:glycosyltransferase family 2 protein [Bryobacteraceae bacterium]